MLDLFTIFSKGGIVLWCFQSTSQIFTPSVNALIRSVILQERSSNNSFYYEGLALKYKLDNEFQLVYVVAYQKILQLSYIDKFLNDIHLKFREKYRDDLHHGKIFQSFQFKDEYQHVLRQCEEFDKKYAKLPKQMRTFEDSLKSQKTVASMIENKKTVKPEKVKEKEKKIVTPSPPKNNEIQNDEQSSGVLDDETIRRNREKLFNKTKTVKKITVPKVKSPQVKKGKQNTTWSNSGSGKDVKDLDYSKSSEDGAVTENGVDVVTSESLLWVNQMKGDLKDIEVKSESEEESVNEFDEEEEEEEPQQQPLNSDQNSKKSCGGGFGVFSLFKSLVGSKTITQDNAKPVLDKMKDHLIAKNVAADIADKLCESVAAKLEGKVLGTFSGIASTVKITLTDSLVQILSPKRQIDILRDVLEAKKKERPFSVCFCGVNGVGKSTNLAKICFWMIENNFRVLIAACDTFRAGAVEQLRTHTRHLNALHPPEKHSGLSMVQLYEKGYGKDAAGIAAEAIKYARDSRIDVVLIDTAGRMQDNEPLMRALAKLIRLNEPDLVLFVGEALVGNEAVDQLIKFNQALADNSSSENPHLIDGIVLTKFDTIDDKVGAAISMTYITGQPIVFVGTGQTYTDLKNLNAKAVVHALMKA